MTKTVKPGQADSRRQHRQHQAKVAENAARVEQLNEGRGGKLPSEMNRTELIAYLKANDAYEGHSRDGVQQLRTAAQRVHYNFEPPKASEDRAERLRLAKEEHRVLQTWIQDGEKPPRPATPNLDAMNADHAAGAPKAKGRKTTATDRLAGRSDEYRKALAAKAQGARGKGKAVTDDELDSYIEQVRKARPDSSMNEELEIAYWIAKLALSRPRWQAAWARVEAKAKRAKRAA